MKPRGLKGEVKAEPLGDVDLPKRCAVEIDGVEYVLTSFSREGAFAYLKFDGVDTPEKAEALRGKFVCADRGLLPKLSEGEYYIADIIGMQVQCDGKTLGVVDDIAQYGAADVYFVKAVKSFSFPKIRGIIVDVDLQNGVLTVDKNLLEQTVVYKD